MTVGGPVVLDLPADRASPVVLRATIRALAETSPTVRLDERELEEVCTAVQEACTNVIRHAYGGDPRRQFRVELRRLAHGLEIEIADDGPPFDITAAPAADLETLSEGGFGVHIIRAWMDEVTAERRDGRNVVRLLRRYAAAVTTGGTDAGRR